MKVLFDTNIIIDALMGREPWKADAEKLILSVAEEKIEGYVTSKQLCDIWFLACRIHKGEEDSGRKAQQYISKLCEVFLILDVNESDIKNALSYDLKDFEDAVVMAVADRTGMDFVVTRNIKDYPDPLSVSKLRSPEEMIKEFESFACN